MLLSRKGGLTYVKRAEQAGYDYDTSSLTQDSLWHTLNLASIIPANAKLVHLRVGAAHASTGRYFRIAAVGDTQNIRNINIATQAANIINESNGFIDCTGQQIAYWATTGTFAALRLTIMGWFL
jgi:hypothetical protein